MRIALLMTGECRQMWLTAPSLYTNVIEPNQADVFLYLNRNSLIPQVDNEEEVVKKIFDRNVKGLIFTDDDYTKEVKALIESNYEKLEGHYRKLNRDKWDRILNLHNTDQYLKLKKCCLAAADYATRNGFKYDLIVRCRPDIGWLNKFDLTLPILPDTLYVNYSMHDVSHDSVPVMVPWVEDTCFFGGQDVMLRFCSDFSDKMVDELHVCHEQYDLSCATEKLLAKVLAGTGIRYTGINNYFNYDGPGWIRPKLSKYYTDFTKSPNYHLVERFCENVSKDKHAVYFDRIGNDIILDKAIIL